MNALTGKENLIRQPKILECAYWCAYSDKITDKNRIRDNYHVEDCKIEEAEKLLRELVNDLEHSGCNLVVWFSDKPKPMKGGYSVPFYLPGKNGNSNSIDNHGIGFVTKDEAIQMQSEGIARAVQDLKNQMLVQQLNSENRELKRQIRELDPGPIGRSIGRLEPYLPAILQKVFDVDVNITESVDKISGNQADEQTQQIVDERAQQIAEESLLTLANGEENFHLILKKLADIKRNDPEKFKMYMNML